MPLFNSDQDYLDAGVAPPEHNPHGVPGDNNEDLQNIIAAQGVHKHDWYVPKEHAGMIECAAGHNIHGQPYDHVGSQLIGTSAEGHPVFKPLVLAEERPDYQKLLKQVKKLDNDKPKHDDGAIGAARPNKNVG